MFFLDSQHKEISVSQKKDNMIYPNYKFIEIKKKN